MEIYEICKLNICILQKNKFLRVFIGLLVTTCIFLTCLKVTNFLIIFITAAIPLYICTILLQVYEKVKLKGSIVFKTNEIIIEETEINKFIVGYDEIQEIDLKIRSIKDDIVLTKGFFYKKKGCNNHIIIYDKNNRKSKFQFIIYNESQAQVVIKLIKELPIDKIRIL